MLDHRMTGESDLADDVRPFRLGLHAGELDAVLDLLHRNAVEAAEEIEMPPGAAELAVGGELQAGLFLLDDDFFDLGILDRLELIGGGTPLFPPPPPHPYSGP